MCRTYRMHSPSSGHIPHTPTVKQKEELINDKLIYYSRKNKNVVRDVKKVFAHLSMPLATQNPINPLLQHNIKSSDLQEGRKRSKKEEKLVVEEEKTHMSCRKLCCAFDLREHVTA